MQTTFTSAYMYALYHMWTGTHMHAHMKHRYEYSMATAKLILCKHSRPVYMYQQQDKYKISDTLECINAPGTKKYARTNALL